MCLCYSSHSIYLLMSINFICQTFSIFDFLWILMVVVCVLFALVNCCWYFSSLTYITIKCSIFLFLFQLVCICLYHCTCRCCQICWKLSLLSMTYLRWYESLLHTMRVYISLQVYTRRHSYTDTLWWSRSCFCLT